MITASNLRFQFGKKILLENASFMIEDGQKAAIVGTNGSGKTTLLKMIAGETESDGGGITHSKDATIGFLPQEAVLDSSVTLFQELSKPFEHIEEHTKELNEIEEKLSVIDHESDEWKKISHRWDFLHHELHRLDAYNVDGQIKKVAAGLGFRIEDLDRACSEFSGGWQMRILLGKILLQNPSVLLLDEPTNHLDLETMIWLEEWIKGSDCDLIMVSHERAFIDKIVNKIIELDRGSLIVYKGNYSNYLELRKERREHQRRAFENQAAEINQIQRFIDKFRANASRATQVQSRVKQLEKMEILTEPPADEDGIHFRFPEPLRSNKEVISLSNVTKKYGEKTVLQNIDLNVYRGEKVALMGVNGAGKTTLVKIMAGAEPPTEGDCKIGSQVVMEYFSQYQHESLNPMNDVINELGSVSPPEFTSELRGVLGAFLFRGDEVFKKVGVLSGGEKTRLRLAKMLYSKANLLILDEPTNHLDIASRKTLENSLQTYDGTIVFVSHDRYFIDKIATKIIEVADGKITSYIGNYTDYARAKKRMEELALGNTNEDSGKARETKQVNSESKSGGAESGDENKSQGGSFKKSKEQKRAEAEQRQKISNQRKDLEKKIAECEAGIAKNEARTAEIDALLASPEVYADQEKSQHLIKEKKLNEEKLPSLMEKWEKAQKELETLLSSIRIEK